MPTLFFTGYPGFLGTELLPRLLSRAKDAKAVCLVQPKFANLARERAKGFDRVRIIEGDITSPIDFPTDDITEIWHLAAIYDLSMKRELGMRVNVGGTRYMLDFAQRCRGLQHFHYISTCYVSGNLPGVFREDDLERGQSFNNFYEETKYLAEIEVRKSGVPWTIYRPAVIVGDSMTGATQKFDGPYFVMQWLERQPRIAVLPVVGRPSRYTFNVVPRDFMVNAIEYVSGLPHIIQKCYQLADPAPLTVDETINVIARATGRSVIRVPLTKALAKFSIEHVPGVFRLLRIPSPAVDYFVHPTTYDTTNADIALSGSGVFVPRLADYAANLVSFAREHPEIGSAAMA
ncbi:MAG: SDR family oxidoreductase [Acidobacteria bacterium]|nr:SDR family oxidoreductase [Acidobacteriota bacterium]MBV9070783.1 SDR family oxidoreductase [Acidobacteriota bacterium]MBV9185229.1 SDR family oxidoreductase [Acidobacteriota bacterium]